jgi:ATP-dependent DNA helicase PIF1
MSEDLFSLRQQSRRVVASVGTSLPPFTDDQQRVFEIMCREGNVFVTGQAGTGKSTLLKAYYAWYKSQNPHEEGTIYITSTTGISSMLVGGMTIHRWSGIESGEKTTDYYVEKIKSNPTKRGALNRWRKTKVLVIDEISMMNGEMLDRLSIIGQRIRGSIEPFGGIKVIFFGDLLQLPPVKSDVFVFDAFCWERLRLHYGYLTTIVRQSDTQFQRILNKIRVQEVDDEVEAYLRSFLGRSPSGEIRPTRLYPLKRQVDHHNYQEMSHLTGSRATYASTYSYKGVDEYDEGEKDRLKFNVNEICNAEDTIELCEGAQVMYLVNDPELNLVNGSRGVIVRFEAIGGTGKPFPVVQFLDGKEHIISPHNWLYEDKSGSAVTKEQLPLILAWAISIHKCQGATLDYCEVNVGRDIFEYGQSYVALSRVKSPDGLFINSFEPRKIKAHPRCVAFYQNLEENHTNDAFCDHSARSVRSDAV